VLTDVGASADFEHRRARIVRVAGREIGIVRFEDELYAVRNVCPHAHAPLCRGVVHSHLVAGEPGRVDVAGGVPIVSCPWHGWEFDLRTGRALVDPVLRVRTYDVVERDGRVLVETGEST